MAADNGDQAVARRDESIMATGQAVIDRRQGRSDLFVLEFHGAEDVGIAWAVGHRPGDGWPHGAVLEGVMSDQLLFEVAPSFGRIGDRRTRAKSAQASKVAPEGVVE